MTVPFRAGGRHRLPTGATIVWSVAEGARGRRWREAVSVDGALRRSVLLEAATDGRPTRLELTGAQGLLTVHPDPAARELHGNVVTAHGIRHLRLAWSADHALFVVGSPAAASIALGRLASVVAVGSMLLVPVVRIDDDLDPMPEHWEISRVAERDWRLRRDDGFDERATSLDADGIPLIPGRDIWPLEAR